MTIAEDIQTSSRMPPWSRPAVFLYVAAYVAAFAFAFLIRNNAGTIWQWDALQIEMLWITIASTYLLGAIVAVVATAWNAVRSRSIHTLAVLNYSLFLCVTGMLASVVLVTASDWVASYKSELPLTAQALVGLAGIVVILAVVNLVTCKPISPRIAFNIGIAALAFCTLASAIAAFGT